MKSMTLLLVALAVLGWGCSSSDDGDGTGAGWNADSGSAGDAADAPQFGDSGAAGEDAGPDTAGEADTATGPADAVHTPNDTGDTGEPTDTADGADANSPTDAATQPDTGPPVPGVGVIAVDPEAHQFSYISPLSQALTKQIAIYNTGTGSVTVTALQMDPSGSADFTLVGVPPLPRKLQPGDHAIALVRFSDLQGGVGTLQITSTDIERPVVEVALSSHIKASLPQPCVGLQPTALSFCTVERGKSKTLPAVVKNCSDTTPLKLNKIQRVTGLFGPLTDEMQIAPNPTSPVVIPPGGSYPVDVTYSPLLAGPDFGAFLFLTDDPDEPQVKLDVSGIGVAPPPEELGLTIKLSWDSNLTDVDSHLVAPGGSLFDCTSDCFFANPAPDWGIQGDWVDDPFLDLDDIDGFGPEHINASDLQAGTYTYTAHYWKDYYEESSSDDANVTVQVFSFNTQIAQFGPVNLPSTNWTWDVFKIDWPSMTITPLGAMYTKSGSGACFGGFWP